MEKIDKIADVKLDDIILNIHHSKLMRQRLEKLRDMYPNSYFAYPDGYVKKCGQKGHDCFEGMVGEIHKDIYTTPKIGDFVCVGWFYDKDQPDVYVYKVTGTNSHCVPTVYGGEVKWMKFDE